MNRFEELLSVWQRNLYHGLERAKEMAEEVPETVVNVLGTQAERLAKRHPKVGKAMEFVGYWADQAGQVVKETTAQFDTVVEVQIDQDPDKPYQEVKGDGSGHAITTVCKDSLIRILFHGSSSLRGTSEVFLIDSDDNLITLRIKPFHEVELDLAGKEDGESVVHFERVSLRHWLFANGPNGLGIRVTRIRQCDFDSFNPSVMTSRGPGRCRSFESCSEPAWITKKRVERDLQEIAKQESELDFE